MKYADVYTKNCITGIVKHEGKAILLNKMDERELEAFYEIRFINDPKKETHCRWIENSKIYEK